MSNLSKQKSELDLVIDRKAYTIRLSRMFAAPKTRVFEAWTQPEHLAKWWDPCGEPLALCEIDLRPGGSFRFVTKSNPEMPFSGKYREIAPSDRLVFETDAGTGRVLLRDSDGRTHMTVEIACRSLEELEQLLEMGVDQGTAATLDNLVDYLKG